MLIAKRLLRFLIVLLMAITFLLPGMETVAANNTWTNIGPATETIQAIAIDPLSTTTIYAGCTQGVYKTTNGGTTWTPINTGLTNLDITHLIITPGDSTTLFATAGNKVYKSTNSGSTWSSSGSTPYSISSIVISPSEPATMYMANTDGVYRSTNSGASWSFAGLYNYNVRELAVDPISPTTVYAGTWGGGVYKSTNGGANWVSVSQIWYIWSLAIAPTTPATLYAGTNQGIFRTTNGGSTWNLMNATGTSVEALIVDPNITSTLYANIYDNWVYQSTDSGVTWAAIGGDGLLWETVHAIAVSTASIPTIYAGGNAGVYAVQVIDNPIPSLTNLSPDTKKSGESSFMLTVTGSSFVNGAVIKWGGTNLTTTYVTNTQLTATVPASYLNTPGLIQITVFNPTPGGGTSNALPFVVQYKYRCLLPLVVK